MAKFKVFATETVFSEYLVEAETEEGAMEKVRNCEYLGWEETDSSDFKVESAEAAPPNWIPDNMMNSTTER